MIISLEVDDHKLQISSFRYYSTYRLIDKAKVSLDVRCSSLIEKRRSNIVNVRRND